MDCVSYEGDKDDPEYEPDSESHKATGFQNRKKQQSSSLPKSVTTSMVTELINRNE